MERRAQALLEAVYGRGATFRPGQLEAIKKIVGDKKRLLVVERTGWGKSLVYFMATRLLREKGAGPTILISPLLALMRNQQDAAAKLNIRAASLNSTNVDEWAEIEEALSEDAIDVLLISPERLANPRFLSETLPSIEKGIGLLVVDEAHCISDWGHDFRPDYRRIVRIVQMLPKRVPVLGTTATANARVVADVQAQLGPGLEVQRGPLMRDSLRLQAIPMEDQAERLAWLAQYVPELPGTGIIYCLTVGDCERVSEWLAKFGVKAPVYHGQLPPERRIELEGMLLSNEVKALVATVALGMGYDKPDLGFVVHFQRPSNIVAYYQQVGRAGRDIKAAYGILLGGDSDDTVQEYFIDSAIPSVEDTQDVVAVIENSWGGLSVNGIMASVNLSKGTVERILKLAEIDGLIGKDDSKYFRTANPWTPNTKKRRDLIAKRKAEMQQMKEFVSHSGCLMQYVAQQLDDPHAQACDRCSNCAGEVLPTTSSPKLVREAVQYLSSDYRVITPRKMWPAGGVGGRRGQIPTASRLEEGRALGFYGASVWGRLIEQGKYRDGVFDDQLVEAVAEMIEDDWEMEPFPEWVTAVPSLKSPTLVPGFAAKLARRLGLPYRQVLVKVKDTPAQKTMQNSFQQAQNAIGAFEVRGTVPKGPVLLVDDVVHSRWTQTVCGALLREAGSGPVYPIALASAATGGGDSD